MSGVPFRRMDLPRPAVIVALLTPFERGGGVDEGAMRAHVDWLVDCGVDALMPCGTTGEGPLLADDEVAAVVRATVAAADDRVPVLAHVGRPGTAPTLALARRAVDDGAAAVAAIVPYYYAPPDDHVRAHYAALIDGVDVPVYAYTIPSHTHRELEPALLERLIADGLAGLKDSTKSSERHREYAVAARSAGAPFALFTGTASLMSEALREDSAGAVLAVANLHPGACVSLVRALRERGGDDAERLQAELAAHDAKVRAAGGIPALKRAVAERVGGSYSPEARGPLAAAPASAPAAG
jgi:dihydrodipicolinate synthase/N-acetylneuraminate lyase